jgi:hypothetical protein
VVEKFLGNLPVERQRRMWEDSAKVDHDCVDWVEWLSIVSMAEPYHRVLQARIHQEEARNGHIGRYKWNTTDTTSECGCV